MEPDRVRLAVAPTADYTLRSLLQTSSALLQVQWFQTSEKMAGDSLLSGGPRLQLSGMGGGMHSLTITNLYASDSAVYTARISSLQSDTNACPQVDASCNEIAIPLLTHNATRPVAFKLTVIGMSTWASLIAATLIKRGHAHTRGM